MGDTAPNADGDGRGEIIDSESDAADHLKSVLDRTWERLGNDEQA